MANKTSKSGARIEYEIKEYKNRIRSNYDKFSNTEKLLADYFFKAETDEVSSLSIGEIASITGTSSSTIVRFCRALGFSGFAEFKYSLKNSVSTQLGGNISLYPEDSFEQIKQKVIDSVILNVKNLSSLLDEESIGKAAGEIAKSNRVLFCGNGSTSGIALSASSSFSSIGIPAFAPADPLDQIRSVYLLEATDVVVGITTCGYIKNVADVLSVAHQRGITTICITAAKDTPSTHNADIVLYIPSDNVALPLDISVSLLSQLTILQILQVAVLIRNYDKLVEKTNDLRDYSQLNHYSFDTEDISISRMRF